MPSIPPSSCYFLRPRPIQTTHLPEPRSLHFTWFLGDLRTWNNGKIEHINDAKPVVHVHGPAPDELFRTVNGKSVFVVPLRVIQVYGLLVLSRLRKLDDEFQGN